MATIQTRGTNKKTNTHTLQKPISPPQTTQGTNKTSLSQPSSTKKFNIFSVQPNTNSSQQYQSPSQTYATATAKTQPTAHKYTVPPFPSPQTNFGTPNNNLNTPTTRTPKKLDTKEAETQTTTTNTGTSVTTQTRTAKLTSQLTQTTPQTREDETQTTSETKYTKETQTTLESNCTRESQTESPTPTQEASTQTTHNTATTSTTQTDTCTNEPFYIMENVDNLSQSTHTQSHTRIEETMQQAIQEEDHTTIADKYEALRRTYEMHIHHKEFYLTCIDKNVFPQGLRAYVPCVAPGANDRLKTEWIHILKKCSFQLLNTCLQHTTHTIQELENRLTALENMLDNAGEKIRTKWQQTYQTINNRMQEMRGLLKEKRKRKLNKCIYKDKNNLTFPEESLQTQTKTTTPNTTQKTTPSNLSSKPLESTQPLVQMQPIPPKDKQQTAPTDPPQPTSIPKPQSTTTNTTTKHKTQTKAYQTNYTNTRTTWNQPPNRNTRQQTHNQRDYYRTPNYRGDYNTADRKQLPYPHIREQYQHPRSYHMNEEVHRWRHELGMNRDTHQHNYRPYQQNTLNHPPPNRYQHETRHNLQHRPPYQQRHTYYPPEQTYHPHQMPYNYYTPEHGQQSHTDQQPRRTLLPNPPYPRTQIYHHF